MMCIVARSDINIYFILLKKISPWHFMWIISLADDLHEISRFIFSEKKKKKNQNVVYAMFSWRFKD